MKKLMTYLIVATVAMFVLQSCSKEEGFGGKRDIKGVVSYTEGAAAGAVIYIAYGTKDATTDFDYSTVADENGNYMFPSMEVGDYFIDAEFTDAHGIMFETPGVGVTLGEKKGEVTVNLSLQ